MPQFEVDEGQGRTEQEIYKQEILNVKANKHMSDREKYLKIRQLETLITDKHEPGTTKPDSRY